MPEQTKIKIRNYWSEV